MLACGGTRITANGTTLQSETVWNNGPGKGATYQHSAGVPPSSNPGRRVGRAVPDVAGNADPQTGWQVRVDGHDLVFGGTSAVAPMWAALVALVNQQLGRRAGFLQPALYPAATASGLRDITTGTNGAYHAGTGWDPCTGLGSPNGTELAHRLATL